MLTEAGKWRLDLASPHQVYKLASGERVPGVTTINGVWEKMALRGWYADMERASVVAWAEAAFLKGPTSATELGRILRGMLPEKDGKPVWAADVKKDRAADIGTVTHARCEAFVKGPYDLDESGLTPDLLRDSMPGFLRFQTLWVESGYTLIHSELQMVSERMRCGGTADIVARAPSGLLVLMDLKTSKASKWWPYPETLSQVAAYAAMYEEVSTNRIDRIVVERIGKAENDPGQSYRVSEAQRKAGLRKFVLAREAYNLDKELKP